MTRDTEYKENLTKEEIMSLAAVLLEEIKNFYNSEEGQSFYEEYLHCKDKPDNNAA